MVAKITVPQNVRRALNYNEQKVKQGKAECLYAGNFLKDVEQMNFHEKLERFTRNIELNKSKTNTLHISLNFDQADRMTGDKMIRIANDYMQRIGFGNQPYLVYRHHDAGHDHCHIVTTNIKDDGKRIDTFNIAKKFSEPARKTLEQEFGLTKAAGRGQNKPGNIELAEKVLYGKSETKRSITNVLDTVIDHYKYSSLHELNAVLRLFNVEADRGKEGSRTHDKGGLHYRIIDEKGNKIGVPIKASSIYSQPTLKNLEMKFVANALLKQDHKLSIQTTINWTLAQQPATLKDFVAKLRQDNIDVVLRQSKDGQLYGLTYVDHGSQTVFNGSDLGKKYSAKGIQDQLKSPTPMNVQTTKQIEVGQNHEQTTTPQKKPLNENDQQFNRESPGSSAAFKLIEQIIGPENINEAIARELREEEKKRRRRPFNLDQEHEM